MAAAALAAAIMIWADVYPFLAPNRPIEGAEVLVIEGWMPDYAIAAAAAEFHRGGYQRIVTTGPPILHSRHFIPHSTFADLSAATLIALGIYPDKVVALPHSVAPVKRTAASAAALQQGLQQAGIRPKTVNLYSLGPHARRSWTLCRAALAPEIQVGILSAKPQEYDPDRWWRSSSGARTVMVEMIGYTYLYLSQLSQIRS